MLLNTIVVAGVTAAGVAVDTSPAAALDPFVIVFSNPGSHVNTGDLGRFVVQVVVSDFGDPVITFTVVGSGCEEVSQTSGVVWVLFTDDTRECNITAYAPGDEFNDEGYAYHTVNARRVDQAPLTGTLVGSGVYGADAVSTVAGGTTGYAITYRYNANCALDDDLGAGEARHVITGGQGNCVVTATRPGDEDYRPVSRVLTLAVHPAILEVDADDAGKVAGDDDPTLLWALSGFVNGDTPASVSGNAGCVRQTGEAPGDYDIDCGQASLSSDDYSFQPGSTGTMTITTRAIPVVTATATAGTGTNIDALAPFGDAFEVISFDAGANGATITNTDGTITFTALAAFSGTDTFTYTVADRFGNQTTVTVTVQVAAFAAPTPPSSDPAPTTTTTPASTTTLAPAAPTTTPAGPAAAPAAPDAVAAPTDGALPRTGLDLTAVLAAAALFMLGGLSLRRVRRV